MTKLTLSIPDTLYERLADYRRYMNISGVCALAIERELDRLTRVKAKWPKDKKDNQ